MKKIIYSLRFYKFYYWSMISKFFGAKIAYNDLISLAQNTVAHRWHGDPVTQYVVVMNILQQDKKMTKGLEIGGGYSTAILTKLVIEKGCKITSIDINPRKYNFILPSRSHRNYLFSLIDVVEDLTIDFHSLLQYYEQGLAKDIAEFPQEKFKEALSHYIVPFDGAYLSSELDPLESLYSEGKFDLKKHVLTADVLKSEKDFYQTFDRVEKKGVINKIVEENIIYDFIFFDCGELSSLVEWKLLKDKIRVGGYAILHDIYFPKSVKNFIVAALIELSDDWEIIYKDTASIQGMLVAKRTK